MNLQLQQWRRRQSKILQKYRTVKSKFKRKRKNLRGKFLLLVGKHRKCATILYFQTESVCEAKWVIPLYPQVFKQTPKRLIITQKKNLKLLRRVSVIVRDTFKQDYLKVCKSTRTLKARKKTKKMKKIEKPLPEVVEEKPVKIPLLDTKPEIKVEDPLKAGPSSITKTVVKTNPVPVNVTNQNPQNVVRRPVILAPWTKIKKLPMKPETPRTVPPLTISKCERCKQRFTSINSLNNHKNACKSDESESEHELLIDDDVEFVLDDQLMDSSSHSPVFGLPERNPTTNSEILYCMIGDCHKTFQSEESLIIHIGLEHESTNKKTFKCLKCPESFSRVSALAAHTRMSHPTNGTNLPENRDNTLSLPRKTNFSCGVCSTTFNERVLLDRHFIARHVNKVYFCYKCHQKFSIDFIYDHMRKIHKESTFELNYIKTMTDVESVASWRCAFCIYTAKQKNRVDSHMLDEHYAEFEISEFLAIEDSSSPDSLENLMLPENEDDLLVEIEIVPKKTVEDWNNFYKNRKKPNDPSFKHRCARCQRRFSRSSGLKSHKCLKHVDEELDDEVQESHGPSKRKYILEYKFECPGCNRKFSRTNNLRDHKCRGESQDSDSMPPTLPNRQLPMVNGFFKCSKCPKVFTSKSMYSEHKAADHGEFQSSENSSS